jgi:predicted AlkP superfamily pyrophosphatase or phosphodiesterase
MRTCNLPGRQRLRAATECLQRGCSRACLATGPRRTSIRAGLRGAVALAAILVLGLTLTALASTNDHVVLITIDGLSSFYLSDPQAPLPTLRKLATQGAVAEGLRVSDPSTTWPNHTTLITGVHPDRHSVLFNGLLVRSGPGDGVTVEVDYDQDALVKVPTVYDHLHRAGYRTAAINWPASRGSSTLDDNLPDATDRIDRTTPRLRAELVRAGILDPTGDEGFRSKTAAARDQAWAAAAAHVLQARRPNLLLLHLLITDSTQHRYGPRSSAAYEATALADGLVAEVLRAIDTAGLRERTTVIVTSDHGFASVTRLVNPNVIFRKAGLLRPSPRHRAQCLSQGGTAFLYLCSPATAEEDKSKVIQLLRPVEGITEILEAKKFPSLHLPQPAPNTQMADLILVARDGYAFSDEFIEDEIVTPLKTPAGSHGYLSSTPSMNGIFLAWGRGIKHGKKLGIVDNIDIAPTIADLLGQTLPDIDGRVLREVLIPSKGD